MESTNPRARVEPSWAPPPPITGQESPEAPGSLSAAEQADYEADFDATLGNLVEQFSTLPPATYGEPVAESVRDDVASTPPRERRWLVPVAALTSAFVGGVVTLAILMGPQKLWSSIKGEEAPAAAPAVATPRAPRVDVSFAPAPKAPLSLSPGGRAPKAPKAEPLSSLKAPQAAAVKAPAIAAAPKTVPAAKEPKKAAPKKLAPKRVAVKKPKAKKPTKRIKKAKPHRRKARVKKKSTTPKVNEWKDPYA